MPVARKVTTPPSIRTIWGLAKSPELMLDEENLYSIVYRETRKDSLRKLSQREINTVVRVLQNMKDDVKGDIRNKRTDTGGSPNTVALRQKIYVLTGKLGWNNDNSRINAFAKRMTGVERLEWLSPQQCIVIIEALKAMLERKNKHECR